MTSTEDLEMIPRIHGKEKTFAWFPPSHDQYARVPYKIMAVLDDLKYFHQKNNGENTKENIKEEKSNVESDGSILSSKLNAIRQDIAKRQVVPNFVKQQCFKKPNNIKEYMKIPVTWMPNYPKANIDILTEHISYQGIVECKDGNKTYSEKSVLNCKIDAVNKKLLSSRPFTAPGHTFKNENLVNIPMASIRNHKSSSAQVNRREKQNSPVQRRLKQNSASESNLLNLHYTSDMDKYKWLMEIPGDPFEIKKPHLPVKEQFFRPIEEIKILPREPRMKKENHDTFFYNSMPDQIFRFDIDPNFMSEKYNRMKNHLRSQGKWNYSSKNFSFVY